MKKYFDNLGVDCWIQSGRMLGRALPCICMRADATGAGLLLKAVEELARENPPARRKVTFRSFRPDAIRSLRLRILPETDTLRKLCVSVEDHSLSLEFTAPGVEDVISALQDWMNGAEDFCLRPRGKKSELGEKDRASGELWFWITMSP